MRLTAFTGYSVGVDASNTLISFIEISCEMPKGCHDFLHAALEAGGLRRRSWESGSGGNGKRKQVRIEHRTWSVVGSDGQ